MKRKRRNVHRVKNDLRPRWSGKSIQPWIAYPLTTLVTLIIVAAVSIGLLSRNLPSLAELEKYDPFLVTRIYSIDGQVLKELYKQNRVNVPLDRIPADLKNAVIALEDRRFFNHWGLDLRRILKLSVLNLIHRRIIGGASTLTQQLARKLYLTPRKSIVRKLREQLTALQIERTYSKHEIFEMYLNQMPFGRGAYGVQAASLRFFGKSVEDLETHESAMLAGMLQLPYGYYSPDRDTVLAKKRRNVVLKAMLDCEYLLPEQYDSLAQTDLDVIDRQTADEGIAPYFTEYVRSTLYQKYGNRLFEGGFSIYTTLDTRVQACAEKAVDSFMPELEQEIWQRILEKRSFADWFDPPLEDDEQIEALLADTTRLDSLLHARATLQAALVALNPSNGQILAMIGGRDFSQWKYNRAVQMKRQPGSAFKPIAYTVAIDNGYTPITEVLNQPVVLINLDGSRWNPPNYDHSTGGLTTLREGLRRSLNLVTVHMVQELISMNEVVKYGHQFGLSTPIHPYPAVALGTDVVIPLELTSAFSVFANSGVRAEPVAILRVEDKDGNILEEAKPRLRDVLSEQTAYIMTDMLATVINQGTGQAARWRYQFNRPAAGKTGTTNDFRNAWFVGYTPQIAAGVWVGMDDERISLGEDRSGARTALPIWAPFMKMAHDSLSLPLADFQEPPGIVHLKICSKSKKIARESCPETWNEIFTSRNAPIDTCNMHLGPGTRPTRKRVIF